MLKMQYLVAIAPIALLWGWILSRAEDPTPGSWLLLGAPLLLWVATDWLASGKGVFSGPNSKPHSEERFFCYLFMGTGTLPLVAAISGIMKMERFMPGFLPAPLGDGLEVAAFCILGLIATSAVRLLGWSDSLFGRTQGGGASGGGP